jgi:hypothetical protein
MPTTDAEPETLVIGEDDCTFDVIDKVNRILEAHGFVFEEDRDPDSDPDGPAVFVLVSTE